jgi:pimeloyl-ACP methyl ester carboxylesterase
MPIAKQHVINLSEKGTFQQSGRFTTAPADVDAIFAELARTQASHLVLHFHGGLVGETQGLQAAERLLPILKDQAGAHPVFFVWESGLWETARRNLAALQNEEIYKTLLEETLRFVVAKLTGSPDSRSLTLDLPPAEDVQTELQGERPFAAYDAEGFRQNLEAVTTDEDDQLARHLKRDADFQQAAADIVAGLVPDDAGRSALAPAGGSQTGSSRTLLSSNVLDEMKTAGSRGLIESSVLIAGALRIFGRAIRRLLDRTDHGVHCTVVEEILRELYLDGVGAWLWRSMKDTIRGAFASNDGRTGSDLRGGTYFVEQLKAYLADPAHPPLKVSLVGHSAGGIYICRFVAKALESFKQDFHFHRIAMLAPGCDFELFKASLVDNERRIDGFRLFNLSDALEARDAIVPVVYPRSLLYFVAGVLEGDQERPLVGLQRCYSGEKPYDSAEVLAARRFITAPGQDRLVYSEIDTAPPGLNCYAAGHGQFDDPLTWASLVHFLKS